jgi:hypothetical protein
MRAISGGRELAVAQARAGIAIGRIQPTQRSTGRQKYKTDNGA